MTRKPNYADLEFFPEQIRKFVSLDREILEHMFENRARPVAEVAASNEFLQKCSEAFTEECKSWRREITFGDFVLETINIYGFEKPAAQQRN